MVKKERTISYFELVNASSQRRQKHVDWSKRLEAVDLWDPVDRQVSVNVETDHILSGSIFNADGHKHIAVASVTDAAEHPFELDFSTGQLSEPRLRKGAGLAEACIISFLEFGNVIAYVRATRSAPPIDTVMTWLNETGVGGRTRWDALPVISRDVMSKLDRAVGADEIEISTGSSLTLASQQGGATASLLRGVVDGVGPVRASLRVSIGARRNVKDSQERMLQQARQISNDAQLKKATARLIYLDGSRERRETVNFLKHRITARHQFDVEKDESFVRWRAAATGVIAATQAVEGELRAAVDADLASAG